MDRESFLGRVRTSLGEDAARRGRPEAYQPPPPPTRDELVQRLTRELEAVGGLVYRVDSPARAREVVLGILDGLGARRVIRGATQTLRSLELDEELERSGIEVTVAELEDGEARAALRDANFVADAGITSADYGVAETGTLALLARPGQGRAVSLLPPVHVAVLREDDVVAELAELFERLSAQGPVFSPPIPQGGLPSALTFVTGPSRTGDIELVLTVGVHGPKELHLVLLR